jgi:3-methylcrotonyl-CoA carboxylase alpha subunit
VRVDSGIKKRDAITPFYDPMIAKLIVWDESREMAVRRMTQALEEFEIVGVANNVEFLRRLVTSPSFTEARLDTSLIEREHEWLVKDEPVPDAAVMIAAVSVIEPRPVDGGSDSSPWAARDGWRMNGVRERAIRLKLGEKELDVSFRYGGAEFRISIDGRRFYVSYGSRNDNEVQAVIDGKRIGARIVAAGSHYHVFLDGRHFDFEYDDPLNIEAQHHASEGSLLAPMPGRVVALSAEPGQRVEKGAALMVLEAMKMECTIHAPAAGRVESFHFAAGDQVSEGVELLNFIRDEQVANAGNGNG